MANKSRNIALKVGMASTRLPVFVWLPIISSAIIGLIFSIIYRVELRDWVFFQTYTPSQEIIELGEDSYLTAEGEQLFQRADPEVLSRSAIATVCPGAHNLGCLVTGPKIYIRALDADTSTLRAEQRVTVVHEMLHMAYIRLDNDTKATVDVLIAEELVKDENRQLLVSLQQFDDSEERADEAYAQLGTQVGSIDQELEGHYRQFVEDRQAIVEAYRISN